MGQIPDITIFDRVIPWYNNENVSGPSIKSSWIIMILSVHSQLQIQYKNITVIECSSTIVWYHIMILCSKPLYQLNILLVIQFYLVYPDITIFSVILWPYCYIGSFDIMNLQYNNIIYFTAPLAFRYIGVPL